MTHRKAIYFVDRKLGVQKEELVYGEAALRFLYGEHWLGKSLGYLASRIALFSIVYGALQRLPSSKKKIAPFIEKYGIDASEFLLPVEAFRSFDDFFSRKLKPEARPIVQDDHRAMIPTDGRFLVYQDVDRCDGFIVKGKKFSLERLIGDPVLAARFQGGNLALGRLCPVDYHRFHFPCDCIPKSPRLIQGPLFSVNPIAVKQRLTYLSDNKRMITELDTALFGSVLFIEIGATNVGSIHQTYLPGSLCKKGEEKGYFSFGGSALAILFEPKRIVFDADLLNASSAHVETLCQMGQSLGSTPNPGY